MEPLNVEKSTAFVAKPVQMSATRSVKNDDL